MKANELMVGDWVYSAFAEHPCKVEGIEWTESEYAYVKISGVDGYKCIESLSSIHLTPEILEKNGFAKLEDKSGKQRYRWEYADGIHISIDFTDTDPWVHVSNRCYFAVPYCEYVHQLQHALRLCGIEKETIL